jgi:F0F1-type ATP synthase assembly protein I
MWQAEDALLTTARKVMVIQSIVTLVAAGLAFPFKGLAFALALIYGGATVLIGTGVQAWRLKLATEDRAKQPTIKPGALFQGMLMKLAVMLAMLAVGLSKLKLVPLALLIGLTLAYSGYLFGRGYAPRSRG